MASLADLVPLLHAQPDPYAPYFDDRLLISLVVALASGHPSVVLRLGPAPLDDAQGRASRHELVRRVADEVAWICAFAFALSSHRVSCSPKLSSTAFLKALFAPPASASAPAADPLDVSPSRKDSFASRASLDAPQRRTPRRSLTGPLEVSVARANDDYADPRRARSPSRLDFLRTPTSPTPPTSLPSSAPPSRISFSDLTGPAPDDGESSAGEDLYPAATSPTRYGVSTGLAGGAGAGGKSGSFGRRTALGARGGALGGSPSPDRERERRRAPGARRHTVGARDASGVGLGLGVGYSGGGELAAPRPASPRLARDGSGYFGPRSSSGGGGPAALAQQHASYLEQADRRPSIASIQSRASTATGASPVAQSGATLGAGTTSPLRAQHGPSPSPLAASSLATPSSSSRPSSPSRPSTPTSRPSPARPRPSSTYPPPSRPASQALGPLPPSSSATATAAAAHPHRALPQVLILEHLERARPSAQQALLGVLRDRRVVLGGGGGTGAAAGLGPRGPAAQRRAPGDEGGSAFRPGRRAARGGAATRGAGAAAGEGEDGGAAQGDGTWNVPEGFVCVAIVWDEGAAGQGAWGGVSRHLLDRFALSHTIPASSLLSSSRFFAPSPPSSTSPHRLAQPALHLPEHALPSYLSDSLDTYTSDLVSALRHHPQLDGRMLTANAVRHLRRATRVWAALTKGAVLSLGPAPLPTPGAKDDAQLDGSRSVALSVPPGADAADALVLPADVLAVALAVVGHRLALRLPEDEKSLFWGSEVGALRGRRGEVGERGRVTVEAVVREVVAVV